jgi:nitrite reductase (NADH) large subunit
VIICADLDEAMSRHVADYQDEWKAVLEDPRRLAQFSSFVNAPGAPDPMITFIEERGQRVPGPAPARSLLPLEPK